MYQNAKRTCRACRAIVFAHHEIHCFVVFLYPSSSYVLKLVILGSLSTRVFETRTATGSELFFLLTCLHTTTFTLLSIFCSLEMISLKICETPLPWHAKCSLPVAVRVSKTRVLNSNFRDL